MIVKDIGELRNAKNDWYSVKYSVRRSVYIRVLDSVKDAIGPQIWHPVSDAVRYSVSPSGFQIVLYPFNFKGERL